LAVSPGEESAVDDFAVQLFKVLHYTGRDASRVVRTRKDLTFCVCGEQMRAQTDVCIMDDLDILLVVQEDKRHLGGSDQEPQLIAEAIAAFHNNNDTHVRVLGLPVLQSRVMP
ncbi:hypothetical protein BD310DRAFT_794174, partial [Dichomitus squalens]